MLTEWKQAHLHSHMQLEVKLGNAVPARRRWGGSPVNRTLTRTPIPGIQRMTRDGPCHLRALSITAGNRLQALRIRKGRDHKPWPPGSHPNPKAGEPW